MQNVLEESKIESLVGKVESLPSVPAVYMELLEALKSQSTSFKTVAEILSKDVAMTAKILQMVNSAFFGFYRNINSVEHAVGILGMRMIRSLVLSVKVFQQYSNEKMAVFPIDRLMQHSVSTGALGRIIAKSHSKEAAFADDCFMAGMLHDVGKLILADKITEQYKEVKAHAAAKAIPFHEAEREKLGLTHADVGAYLMKNWGIAENIVQAIEFHHYPIESGSTAFNALTVVHAANVFEHLESKDDPEGGPAHAVNLEYLKTINMADRVDKWAEICHVLKRDER